MHTTNTTTALGTTTARATGGPEPQDHGGGPAGPLVVTADLLEAARAGDPAAWSTLVGRHAALIRSVARRCGVRDADLADVAQEVWLRTFRRLDQLREPGAFVGWVATLTRRTSVDVLVRAGRATPVDTGDVLVEQQLGVDHDGPDVDAGLRRADEVRAVRAGLARLTSGQRELLLLVTAEPPVPYRVIAARLGMPVGSIGPTRARLLRRLAETEDVAGLLHDEPATGDRRSA